jgi:alpha-L-fucosidase 2
VATFILLVKSAEDLTLRLFDETCQTTAAAPNDMNMLTCRILCGLALLVCSVELVAAEVELTGSASPPGEPLSLWYRQPAAKWVEALPVGNGRIGAMVFGGINQERLQLNEDTLWAGGPYDPVNPQARGALPEVRRLIFAGKYREAAELISAKVMSKPLRQMPYETAGDLILTFPDSASVENYRRDLNLDTAVAGVEYTVRGTRFSRQVFASPVDQVLVIRLTADKKNAISFTAGLRSPQQAEVSTESGDTLLLTGVNGAAEGIRGALRFQVRAKLLAEGGTMNATSNSVAVLNANSVTLLVAAATSYRNFQDVSANPEAITKARIAAAAAKDFNTLLAAHLREHQRLFRRVALDLGSSAAMRLPTDERIRHFDNGQDPQFAALYFQFGRYLLLSCSRPGGQPANLQGLWNESMNPPWGSKYTININTEMNYWPAESCHLAECVEPLIAMVKDLSHTGARTAREMYGARGWVTHHNTDLWRATGPIDGPASGMWPTGGAWLCDYLWDHYQFGGDTNYLKGVYPVMREAAQFFLDTLVEEPQHHWLVTNPSLSPENGHPFGATVCAGPSMDEEILRDLFANTIQASEILGQDNAFRARLAATRARLAPPQIGSAGQLQEWLADWDLQAPDIHHRHVSHLYALYPSWQINVFDTPKLAAAARKSLEIRGDESTGWATAWRINLWDRLRDGDHAYRILEFLLSPKRTYPDMFDAHPPFQIDGNFGGTAGIEGMLLQSRALQTTGAAQKFEIELLPALPSAWPAGRVSGLRARGGFEISEQWQDGKLAMATVRSLAGNPVVLRYGTATHPFQLKPGATFVWNGR